MSGLAHPTEHFRPDLEGLRAVAVVLVLLYHANIPGFNGGYVGVDVFFVLSGFLITGVIYRELRTTGGFDLPKFYARRARRLLPAAAVALLVTLLASALILPFFRLSAITADIASAAFYVSNMRFGIQANDYFQATADPSPVLHFWSLSIEEQFYIFWPALLLAAHHWLRLRSRRNRVTLTIVVIGLVSLVVGVWLTEVNQPWAFFLLPTRAWELAIGGLIAVRARELAALPRQLIAVATPLGVALVIASAVLYSDATPFPGVAALLPVAGSVFVIAGGLHGAVTLSGRILSLAPMRYLGQISYSLYLWHWPMIVLGTAVLGDSAAPLLAFAAIGVAAVSQRVVEEPMRHGRLIGAKPRWNLMQTAAIGAIIVAISYSVSPFPATPGPVAPAGVPSRTPIPVAAVTPPIASPSSSPRASAPPSNSSPTTSPTGSPIRAPGSPDGEGPPPAPCSDCTIADLVPSLDALLSGFFAPCDFPDVLDPKKCVLGSPASSRVIAVFGDSFAAHLVPAFEDLARTYDVRILNLIRPACPSATLSVWSATLKRVDTECDQWRERALTRIEAEEAEIVVMANSNAQFLVDANDEVVMVDQTPDGPHSLMWVAGMEKTGARLSSIGARIAIISQPVRPALGGFDPVACISTRPTDFQQACQGQRITMVSEVSLAIDHAAATGTDATLVDPTPWLCDQMNCPAVIDRFIVYRDQGGHLTAPFVISLADRLAQAVGLTDR